MTIIGGKPRNQIPSSAPRLYTPFLSNSVARKLLWNILKRIPACFDVVPRMRDSKLSTVGGVAITLYNPAG